MARGSPPARAARLLGRLAGSMEMPRDVMLDAPRVTVIGALQAYVENHKGILEYTPSRVRVRTRDGLVTVTGSRLKIGRLFREELVIDGRVDRVELEPAEAPGSGEPRS
ncbi:MAG: sporulation protein YqfC [Clostridia bacterium]|nr:sporulation protein YqfC [Bacillota bacterium]MBO2520635.1 sporulation protein YqfC [Bacillota bacterium]